MPFTPDEQAMLRESAERYVAPGFAGSSAKRERASADGALFDSWSTYAELGWLGVAIPEQYDGSGGGIVELMIIMEAVGRGLLGEPLLSTAVTGARLVELTGSPEQRAEVLCAVASGRLKLAFAHREAESPFGAAVTRTIARRSADGHYRLTGRKIAVMDGNVADQIIVSANLEQESGPTVLFLVEKSSPGLFFKALRGIDGSSFGNLELDEVLLSCGRRLGSEGCSAAIADALDRSSLCACAEALGALQMCHAVTLEHLKTRRQFGRALSNFQVLQHRLVDMTIAIAEVRAMNRSAAEAIEAGMEYAPQLICAANVKARRAGNFVAEQSIQLHGGIGMTDDVSVGHYYKRLLALESLFGDAERHLDRLSAMEDHYAQVMKRPHE